MFDVSFCNDGYGTPLVGPVPSPESGFSKFEMRGQARFANMPRHTGMDGWGNMPRDIQGALFETAMGGTTRIAGDLPRLLHHRHSRTLHPLKPGCGTGTVTRVYGSGFLAAA
jgi:hypothetical protein